ncbi:asparaginase-domain-containing protein [Hyaloraphidium curvatum]|nr:asparaginase-domain-containing protein [Hyaloraphidium curvatum]
MSSTLVHPDAISGDTTPVYESAAVRQLVASNALNAGSMLPADLTRVLVIYTGGTIGMRSSKDHGYVPVKGYLLDTLLGSSRFHDPEGYGQALGFPDRPGSGDGWTVRNAVNIATSYPNLEGGESGQASPAASAPSSPTKDRERFSDGTSYVRESLPALITPRSIAGKRILYSVLEYSVLLDSANMGLNDWARIATDIELNYLLFDSFIVLHGTDTMAFTASALSFMLEALGKTVILTGSQIPLSEVRNDAVENLLGSLTIAGHYTIPEVCLYFGNRLFRGNRSSKVDATDFDAFESPNLDPLVRVGIDITVDWSLVLRPREIRRFRAHKRMEPRVATLKLFPGIATSTLRAFLSGSIRGIVLETFGSGNAPSNRPDLLDALREACRRGSVTDAYETSRGLAAVGVVPGYDMTPEAALTKLSYLLSKNLPTEEVHALLRQSLRGELTVPQTERGIAQAPTDKGGGGFAEELLELVRQSSAQRAYVPRSGNATVGELSEDGVPVAEAPHVGLERELLPLLVFSCINKGDAAGLEYLLNLDPRCMATRYGSGKTPLHIACVNTMPDVVRCLLSAGASVHARDKQGHTPLYDAITSDGSLETPEAAEKLRFGEMRDLLWKAAEAATAGDLLTIEVLMGCGLEMTRELLDGRTVLHVACTSGRPEVVRAIAARQLAQGTELPRDRWGRTPLDDALHGAQESRDPELRAVYEECASILRGCA